MPFASAFDLADHAAAKHDPVLIDADEAHFAALAACIATRRSDVADRLAMLLRSPDRHGQAALERDLEIHRRSAELRLLHRFGLDLCLGRMVPLEGDAVHVGRVGIADDDGVQLLVDWRTPAAAPFFAATAIDPMGLASRRRYRWALGRVRDYWDEILVAGAELAHAALDDPSAFVASLGESRSSKMRDVLGTIQADQHAIIRASSRGPLVVDGGPGTGKTVVAFHRAAQLLHAEPRVTSGGVLVIGPSDAYLAYVDDVLPSLGEAGVRTATLRDLTPEGAGADREPDPDAAALKADIRMLGAVERAVRVFEEPPMAALELTTPWGETTIDAQDWADAFAAPEPGIAHDDGRTQVWDALVEILLARLDDEASDGALRAWLAREEPLIAQLDRAWRPLDASELVGWLWTVPALLRRSAPWLSPDEVALLQRPDPRAWTLSDLPLLDAARRRIGDPARRRHEERVEAAIAAERADMDDVVRHLVEADDDFEGLVTMLLVEDARTSLEGASGVTRPEPDALAGPFAHVIVDEAQELTDAEWRMVLDRCPSRSLTIVGDRAQARRGFAESWHERLERVGVGAARLQALTINYRTPAEVMMAAEPVIRAVLPDANVPASVRRGGACVGRASMGELTAILEAWLADTDEGVACVIGAAPPVDHARIRSLSPDGAKGLEFDLVALVEHATEQAESARTRVMRAVDRYVAMTRTTDRLVLVDDGGARNDGVTVRT